MATAFESEFLSQGELLNERAKAGRLAAERAARSVDEGVTHLVIAARGSSDSAALYLQYLLGQELGLLAALATPLLYADPLGINLTGALVMGISQSGQSPGVVSVLAAARAQGRPAIAITNDALSPLAQQADAVIPLLVGEEVAFAATKTLLASMQAAAQFVKALAGSRDVLPGEKDLPSLVTTMSEWALEHVASAFEGLALDGLTVVGRGLGFGAAQECALKIREVSGVRAEAYALPDLLHGPIGANGSGSTMWLLLTDEVSDDSAADLITRAKYSGMTTLVLRTKRRKETLADVEMVMPIETANWITPFLNIVVGQVMALRLGEVRQRPIDQPPGLKKVTLTD
ncbi:MAG: SIS domain-containing protein [Acidimicrobiales bacterium]